MIIESEKSIREQITSWKDIEDILASQNESINLPYPIPMNREEKSLNASLKISKITKIYNGSTILDFTNVNQYKYRPYKYFSDGRWVVDSAGYYYGLRTSASHHFKSREDSDDAVAKFRDIYDDFWMV